ncbi:Holliday junction resolvase RuvX [Limnobacter humi]|uniref:Putative pre-16S rRNA nuclease n=1 Tax=Limnobacter humi TaxID=1778671 RepID=A0ABT1WCJ1_9BURK|nr:Holliday junction resolvase RuvX [Limnobacter humi]MCQ8895094.1 Holliday junction resolvase RuvX [Limnobacter humi]
MHTTKPTLLLAFDFGLKRIGVAFGNTLTKTTTGVGLVEAEDDATRFKKIEALIREWQPEGLVVGVPRHDDGQDNEMTARCQRFARQLEGRFGLPCATVDERYTSVIIESCMGGAKARELKGRVDVGSACLILDQYFLEGR